MRPRILPLALALGAALPSGRAWAYRPFVGTDADTAKLGEFELEIGPGYLQGPNEQQQGSLNLPDQRYLELPDTVFNLGILPDTELVVDVTNLVQVGDGPLQPSLSDDDILVKHVWREGALQDKTGLSVATEQGLLLPEVPGTRTFGASLAGMESDKWDFFAFHLNEQVQYSRNGNLDLYGGVILEGPPGWWVRPVAELYWEREFHRSETWSGLVGALWTLRDSLVFDLGLRAARFNGQPEEEVRAGLTWSIPVWEPGVKTRISPDPDPHGGSSRDQEIAAATGAITGRR